MNTSLQVTKVLTLLSFTFLSVNFIGSPNSFAQSDFESSSPRFGGSRSKTSSRSGDEYEKKAVKKVPVSKEGVPFNRAYPEDITGKTFSQKVETFDYANADINDLVQVMSELTGKNFIVEPGVKGKITIIARTPITIGQAYNAFLSALAVNGLTVVQTGPFLKITRSKDALKDALELYAGSYFPNSDQMITKMIQMKHISAGELEKTLKNLVSKDGELKAYSPTNSLILSDYGSNVERILEIVGQLDVAGFEERMEVIPIRYAKAKEISSIIDKVINKGEKQSSSRFRRTRPTTAATDSLGSSVSLSFVTPDDRTNSIIVLGNDAGIDKVKSVIAKLDFRLGPEDSGHGGVYVYYMKHTSAEEIAETLNGIAKDSAQITSKENTPGAAPAQTTSAKAIFGGEISIRPDKNTNSLIITASKQDYAVVENLLSRIDIARDQVYVETIIMEMNVNRARTLGLDFYYLDEKTGGAGRIGFRGTNSSIADLANPLSDSPGVNASFGFGDAFTSTIGGVGATLNPFMGLIRLLKRTGAGNILSTPKILAMDNEKASIEVGQEITLGSEIVNSAAGSTTTTRRQKVQIKLEITPSISPNTDTVRLELNQIVEKAQNPSDPSTSIAQRALETKIVVKNGETAVLGGLMEESDSESITKVPILGDIPLLGWLFKSKSVDKTKTNLLIFITPKIIRNSEQSKSLVKEELDERLDFIKNNMRGRDPYGKKADELRGYKPDVMSQKKSNQSDIITLTGDELDEDELDISNDSEVQGLLDNADDEFKLDDEFNLDDDDFELDFGDFEASPKGEEPYAKDF